MGKKKLFFGWTNFKWFVTEVMNIYSTKPSYFSKKRIESGIAFVIAQHGMVFFLAHKYTTLTMGEFLLWAGTEFAVCGYMVNKIQKDKVTQDVRDDSAPIEEAPVDSDIKPTDAGKPVI